MRNNGQKQRMRGRNNNRKSHNPLGRLYESNGPDVKIRGTASHIAEKYVQLARDSQSSGDPVSAENYYQHAEHYFRLIAAAQEQFRQTPQFYRGEGGDGRDEAYEEADEMSGQGPEGPVGTREPHQPYPQRDRERDRDRESQPYGLREPQPQGNRPQHQQSPQPPIQGGDEGGQLDRLPAFITGGGAQPQPAPGQNGFDAQGERYSHRRRRRHRGPRVEGGANGGPDTSDDGPQVTPPPAPAD